MPYIITKKNGKKFKPAWVFNHTEVERLSRDPSNCYVMVSPVTRRSIRVGGGCKGKTTDASLWGARRKRRRR